MLERAFSCFMLEDHHCSYRTYEIKNKQIKIKKTEIKESLKGELSQNDIFVIKECLDSIRFLDQKIKEFDSKININLKGMRKGMEILTSIPGVGFTTAASIMAEIGNIEEFSKTQRTCKYHTSSAKVQGNVFGRRRETKKFQASKIYSSPRL